MTKKNKRKYFDVYLWRKRDREFGVSLGSNVAYTTFSLSVYFGKRLLVLVYRRNGELDA
jgi:hypothetical protein